MSATILDGRATRAALLPSLKERVRALKHVPMLVIIQVGNRPDSTAFIRAKRRLAQELGINEKHIELPVQVSQQEIQKTIEALNNDPMVHGIIVQLPLPAHLDSDVIIEAVSPTKDVDGLTTFNMNALAQNKLGVMPATARGIRELLAFNKITIRNKTVAVIGRSKMVGTPIAMMCKAEGANVVVGHRETVDLIGVTQKADIIIVATGHRGLITSAHVRPGQVVIDVGITRSADIGLVGDVDFDAVKEIVAAITPVPGGVGPMTVFALFENLVDLSV